MSASLFDKWATEVGRASAGKPVRLSLEPLRLEQRAELAMRLSSARRKGDIVELYVRAAPGLAHPHLPKSSMVRVSYNLITNDWTSDIGTSQAPGLLGLAGHVWSVSSGVFISPFEAALRLLACLGAAVLREGVE